MILADLTERTLAIEVLSIVSTQFAQAMFACPHVGTVSDLQQQATDALIFAAQCGVEQPEAIYRAAISAARLSRGM